MDITNKKKCSNCKTFKSYDNFYKASNTYDGLQNYCKDCRKELNYKTSRKTSFYKRSYSRRIMMIIDKAVLKQKTI